MPQTNEGILLFVGAIFFLIGILGGGFEISAIKIPSVGKYIRVISGAIGLIFMGIAVWLYIFPQVPPQPTAIPTVSSEPAAIAVAPPTATIQPGETSAPVTSPAPLSPIPPARAVCQRADTP